MKLLILSFIYISYSLAGTKDIYNFKWLDPKKRVYVLQNKRHKNKKKLYLNLGYGMANHSDFQDSKVMQGQLGYFFAEQWGLELFYNSYSNENNSTYDSVYFADNAASNRVPYLVNINSSYGMYLNFSPFYGKINTFNLIYYIHWSFGIGYAIYNTSNNYDAYLQETTDFFTDRDRRGPTAKTQIKWYLSRMFTVNVDFVGYWFKDREPVADSALKFRNYSDIIFSLGLTF